VLQDYYGLSIQAVVGGFGSGAAGKGVGSRTGQCEKTARDCTIGVLRIVGLCPGFIARRRSYENRIDRSGNICWGWSDGASTCHAVPDREVSTSGRGTSAWAYLQVTALTESGL
jgi:hypothetical protein